jgi:multiple sugar transport system substrate-binding protein
VHSRNDIESVIARAARGGLSRRDMLGRTAALGLSLSGLGAFASACGSGGSADQPASEADALSVAFFSHHESIDKAAVDLWKKRSKLTPRFEGIVADNHRDKIISAFRTNSSPWDTIPMWNMTLPEMAHRGWLVDLSDLVQEMFGGDFDQFVAGEALFQAARYKDGIYGIPVDVGGAILHWNKELLKDADVDPEAPASWHETPGSIDEFIAFAKATTSSADERWGFADNWGDQVTTSFNTFIKMFGGQSLDLSKNQPWGEVTFNQQPGVEALEFMVDLLHTHKVIDPGSVTYNWVFDFLPGFLDGRTAMVMTYPFVAHTAQDEKESKVVGKTGWAPNFAAQTSATTEGTEFIGVPEFAPNGIAIAQDYVNHRTSLEVMRIQGEQGVWAPIYTSLYEEPAIKEAFFEGDTIVKSLEYPSSAFVTPDFSEWTNILKASLQSALSRKQSPQDALNDAAKRVEESRVGRT